MFLIKLGVFQKLCNAVGVSGWFSKVLLLQSLSRYVIDKMTAKVSPHVRWVGGQKTVKNALHNL